MIKLDKHTRKQLIELFEKRKISIEGNILKIIDPDGDEKFEEYLEEAIEKDKNSRRKRLEVTKKVQKQNTELTKGQKENNRVNRQLTKALEEAEEHEKEAIKAKDDAIKAKDEAEASKIEALHQKRKADKARVEAENAKKAAENDLELLQRKTQFELIGTIVNVALWIILGVGITTTIMYGMSLFSGTDTTVISSTWNNIMGILLTNAFSIIGTIMGVKYASRKKDDEN
jgi:Fe2+ transport system protein B